MEQTLEVRVRALERLVRVYQVRFDEQEERINELQVQLDDLQQRDRVPSVLSSGYRGEVRHLQESDGDEVRDDRDDRDDDGEGSEGRGEGSEGRGDDRESEGPESDVGSDDVEDLVEDMEWTSSNEKL